MILIIDNYDSFVHNLARYVRMAGWRNKVVRNNMITFDKIERMKPEAIIISPGPCSPNEAGLCVEIIRNYGHAIPILGVCLGHQCIAVAYGDIVTHAQQPMHGMACDISHNGKDIFTELPYPLKVGRYHSLIVELRKESPLKVTARSDNKEIMAMRHKDYPVYGVQFHPESVLTSHGLRIIENFKTLTQDWHENTMSQVEVA